jgi:hypothetical protein
MNIIELDYNETSHEPIKPNTVEISNFLHIQSSDRNTQPGNVLNGNINNLPNNALKFIKNSNLVAIYYPNNPFKYEDEFVLENVTSDNLTGNFFIQYVVVNGVFQINISYPPNYSDDVYNLITNLYDLKKQNPNTDLQIVISNLVGGNDYLIDIDKKYIFETIPLNSVNDIPYSFNIGTMSFVSVTQTTITRKCLSISVNYPAPYAPIGPLIKNCTVKSLFVAGIPLNQLNSNYPLDINHLSPYHIVSNGSDPANYIYFNTQNSAILTTSGGGDNIKLIQVINKVPYYPYSSNFYNLNSPISRRHL